MKEEESKSSVDDNHEQDLSAAPSASEARKSRVSFRRILIVAICNLLAILLILSLLELVILGSLRFTSLTAHLPKSLRYYPIWTYTYLDRTKVYDYYKYDENLAYILQPNVSTSWTNREFSVLLESNTMGFRDDEESLDSPEVIALGDSFCMGWGVEADESYAQIVERELGLNVLNAGLPSYGTAREVLLCNSRIDTSGLKYLIVQYCENDLLENTSYIENDRSYSGGTIESFNRRTNSDRRNRDYFFGKYLLSNLYLLSDKLRSKGTQRPILSPRGLTLLQTEFFHLEHAKKFLSILSELRPTSPDFQLILFDLIDANDVGYLREGVRFDSNLFMRLVAKAIEEEEYPEFIESALLIDSFAFLEVKDYFVLDGHINRRGHQKVAQHIIEAIHTGNSLLDTSTPLLTTPQGRAAYSVDAHTEPLPETAFRSEITCDRQEITIPAGQWGFNLGLTIHNNSPDWWYAQASDEPYYIQIRAHLLDSEQTIVSDNFADGIVTMRFPLGPNSSFDLPIHLSADNFPPGVSYLEYDVVLEDYASFKDKGGQTCMIKIVKE
ncbi:MAG: hypothetical protein IID08_03240 [Candidatus Hydrogenedentes bacterium]|nr:hypothetical protein [Candidatus Hydrogenedentota bacterium]